MSSKNRKKRGPLEHWVRLDDRTLKGESWQGLSAAAKIFYIHLKSEYYKSNNGNIRLSYSQMKNVKGCCCDYAISKAIKELKEKDWITIKKKGGLYRYYNLFKLTFKHDFYGK